MTFSVGFVSGSGYQHNDMPSSSLTENTIGLMVGHLNQMSFPGAASSVEVYADGSLLAGYTVSERCVENVCSCALLNLISLQLSLRIRSLRRPDDLQCDRQLVVQTLRYRRQRISVHAH